MLHEPTGGGLARTCLAIQNYSLAAMWDGSAATSFRRLDRQAVGFHLGSVLLETVNQRADLLSCRTTYILGDPTLVGYVVAPPGTPSASVVGQNVTVTWAASPEQVAGYYVYRGSSVEAAIENEDGLRTADPVATTQFTEPKPPAGTYTYVVRSVKVVNTGAGSFNNLSQSLWSTLVVP